MAPLLASMIVNIEEIGLPVVYLEICDKFPDGR